MKTEVLEIQNLKCQGCANTITSQLSKIDGVDNVLIFNDTNRISFSLANKINIYLVKNKLAQLGYPVAGETNNLAQKAKSFVSCAVGRLND